MPPSAPSPAALVRAARIGAGLLALAVTACDGGGGSDDERDRAGTSAPAPVLAGASGRCDGLDYGNTAAPLAERYCLRCHRTQLVVRPGEIPPTGLDDEPSWLLHGGHALELLRAGAMPLLPPRPGEDEIARVERWLACEDALRPHGHGEEAAAPTP